MADPRVAVVMITHNRCAEADTALARLESLPEQPEQPAVIVVDNGSSDGTSTMVRARHPQACLLTPGANLGAVGRNLGVALTDAPYVAFCDDDTWWDDGSLTAAADLLDEHPRLAVLTADIRVEPGDREDPICEEMRRSPLPTAGMPGYPMLGFLAGASVVRRAAFEAAGGFSPRLWLGGEEELLAVVRSAAVRRSPTRAWSASTSAGCPPAHEPATDEGVKPDRLPVVSHPAVTPVDSRNGRPREGFRHFR